MTRCRSNVSAVTEGWQIEFHNPMGLPQNLSTSCLGQAGGGEIEKGRFEVQKSYCVDGPRGNLSHLGEEWWLQLSSPDFFGN